MKLLSSAQVAEIRKLLNRWDPAGLRPDDGGPADHYDSHLPWIVLQVQGGSSAADLCDHLGDLRTETMRLPADRAADRAIAEAILAVAQVEDILH